MSTTNDTPIDYERRARRLGAMRTEILRARDGHRALGGGNDLFEASLNDILRVIEDLQGGTQ
jgi:hypothetical protein